jgi:hypothetical protein
MGSKQCKLPVTENLIYRDRINWDHNDKHVQCKLRMKTLMKSDNLASNVVQHFLNSSTCLTRNVPKLSPHITIFFSKGQKQIMGALAPEEKALNCLQCNNLHTQAASSPFDVCCQCLKTTALSAKAKIIGKVLKHIISPFTNNRYLSRDELTNKLEDMVRRLRHNKRQIKKIENDFEVSEKSDKDNKLKSLLSIALDSKSPEHLKRLDLISDEIRKISIEVEGRALQSMRYSEASKDFYAGARMLGGNRVSGFISLNRGGPSSRFVDKEVLKGKMHFEMNKVSATNMGHVMAIYNHIIKNNPGQFIDRDIILNVGFDETGVIPAWNWNSN